MIIQILYRKINTFFADFLGFDIIRNNNAPKDFKKEYDLNFAKAQENKAPFKYVKKAFRYDVGNHPEDYKDFECLFAADAIAYLNPVTILDIGSYRHFIMGLLAHYKVTTIDVRERSVDLKNETIITCDSKNIQLPNNSYDMILSICAIEHFGLGRYGDTFDLSADKMAIAEMKRVLKPGGHFVFTIPITKGQPFIAFNAHRVYSYDMIKAFCSDLELICHKFYSYDLNSFCTYNQITYKKNRFDIFCGCFRKQMIPHIN